MKKLLITGLLILASPLMAVDFQLTNNKGRQVTVTFKEALETDAQHADDAFEISVHDIEYYRMGDIAVAGPFIMDNEGTTIHVSLPIEHEDPLAVTRYFVIVEWDTDGAHQTKRQLHAFFPIANLHYVVHADGGLTLTQESENIIEGMLEEQEELLLKNEAAVKADMAK